MARPASKILPDTSLVRARKDIIHELLHVQLQSRGIAGQILIFKRGLIGSFHQISRKHLDRYLDEFEFRYNNRRNPYLFRDTLTRLVQADALPYEQLTA